ncbi:MAG: hypothetical protein ACI9IL_000894 [Rickettsiales bacterium]|jgi:hypothetical protein
MVGLEAAKKRGKIDQEKLNTIFKLMKSGKTKAEICRSLEIPRSTLNDVLKRVKINS